MGRAAGGGKGRPSPRRQHWPLLAEVPELGPCFIELLLWGSCKVDAGPGSPMETAGPALCGVRPGFQAPVAPVVVSGGLRSCSPRVLENFREENLESAGEGHVTTSGPQGNEAQDSHSHLGLHQGGEGSSFEVFWPLAWGWFSPCRHNRHPRAELTFLKSATLRSPVPPSSWALKVRRIGLQQCTILG